MYIVLVDDVNISPPLFFTTLSKPYIIIKYQLKYIQRISYQDSLVMVVLE